MIQTKNINLLIFAVIVISLGGCGYNKAFYHPDTAPVQTPPDAKSVFINYGNKDSIHSLFYEQKSPKASIFILHGNAGNLTTWSEMADLLFLAGYNVFIIDYPEFGNSSGKAKHEEVYLSTQAAVDYFNSIPQVVPTKKILFGFSLGGNLAIKVATDNPNSFDALIVEGAFDSHKYAAKNTVPRPIKGLAYLTAKNHINGTELIQSWTKPLLVVHSKEDKVCDYSMGKAIYDAATGTTQKELWTIKGPHLAGMNQGVEQYLYKIEKLIPKD
jgi:alpha-beta hydrolase superfamily lysophospholipase